MALGAPGATRGAESSLWLAPPDDITQKAEDFRAFFTQPENWKNAAQSIAVFSINATYLLLEKPEIVRYELAKLNSLGIKLNVSVPALSTDKHICGSAIEGMIWPGELALTARRLKSLGAEVDSFSFDLPLTSGHISTENGACQFSIPDTAGRLAAELRGLRKIYPVAKLIDTEIPTGMPPVNWISILRDWIQSFGRASGEKFYGLTLDVWWRFPWKDTVRLTADVLRAEHIRAGIFLDSSAGPPLNSTEWISEAKQNGCALRDTAIPMDYIVVSNWLNMKVANLPETDSTTLTSLLDWAAAGMSCAR